VQKLLRQTDHVIFSFDGDSAGRRAARRALDACLPHANDDKVIKFLFLPKEHDPDSYIREFGADAFELEVIEKVRGKAAAHAREVELIAEFKPKLNTDVRG
jgi:DNA primase